MENLKRSRGDENDEDLETEVNRDLGLPSRKKIFGEFYQSVKKI